jgi:hypothetical protein
MTRFHQSWLLGAAAAVTFGLTALTAPTAQAAFVQDETFTGTDATCSGPPAGNGFDSCSVTVDGIKSPSIIKYDDFNEDTGQFDSFEVNSQFGSIDGDEFVFAFTDEFQIGMWTYANAAAPDPNILAYSYCGGGQCELWTGFGSTNASGIFDLSDIGRDISNITFYDTGVVPLPAAGWMMLGGLGMIGAALRRRRLGAAST